MYLYSALNYSLTPRPPFTFLGMVVARVRISKLTSEAYKEAFRAMFSTIKADHPKFTVGKTLYGVIVDWSDAQIRGLKEAVGSELAMEIIKGCQVC